MRRVTNDEHEIRHWASLRNARPVQRAKLTSDTEPAYLDFVFGSVPEAEEQLHPIDWATFFAMFHLMGLALAYEEDDFELLKMEGVKSGRFEGKPLMS